MIVYGRSCTIASVPGSQQEMLVQALALLGKLGGRNRRFLKDPLELDLKDNPEHGLRLILTFQPSTSFLVPLDRCLALSSQSLLCPTSTPFPLSP